MDSAGKRGFPDWRSHAKLHQAASDYQLIETNCSKNKLPLVNNPFCSPFHLRPTVLGIRPVNIDGAS